MSDPLPKSDIIKLASALVLLCIAAFSFSSYFQDSKDREPQSYFYDLSEAELFVASKSLFPPIQGINDEELDGVRAIVIAPEGECGNPDSRKIAYLQKYSPQLKKQMETIQTALKNQQEKPANIGRGTVQSYTFVSRPDKIEWHTMDSPEANRIVGEWREKGAGGSYPDICTPDSK